MSFRPGAAAGIRWNSLSQYGQQGLLLATTAVLSRLLKPSDFGILSMALVVTRFPLMFNDLGTASGVIQHEAPSDALLSSVFWMNVLFGLLVAVFIFVGAPFAADFYGEPILAPVLRVLSSLLVFSGPRNVLQALLEREYNFASVARAELAGAALGSAIALSLGFNRQGIWSLVALNVVGPAVASVLIWTSSRWRPACVMRWSDLRVLARYGGNLTAFNITNFLSRNADNVIIGRVLGAEALGYYTLAYTLMLYPLKSVSGVIGRGVLPTFARLQHDLALFRDEFEKVAGLAAAFTFPMMFALCAASKPLIVAAFGEKWRPAIPLIMILAPVGMAQSILTFNGVIYQSTGRTDRQFYLELLLMPLVISSFFLGLRWGIVGVAGAYAAMSLALAIPSAHVAYGLIGLSIRQMSTVLVRPLAVGVAVALAIVGLRAALPSTLAPLVSLAIAAAAGAGVYFLAARRLLAPEFARLQSLLRA